MYRGRVPPLRDFGHLIPSVWCDLGMKLKDEQWFDLLLGTVQLYSPFFCPLPCRAEGNRGWPPPCLRNRPSACESTFSSSCLFFQISSLLTHRRLPPCLPACRLRAIPRGHFGYWRPWRQGERKRTKSYALYPKHATRPFTTYSHQRLSGTEDPQRSTNDSTATTLPYCFCPSGRSVKRCRLEHRPPEISFSNRLCCSPSFRNRNIGERR